ncbi:hypothetical protein Tco_0136951, partial [Tanacetum coccineum]
MDYIKLLEPGMKPCQHTLLDNEFQRGKIDKTLFIKRYKGDILLVQVYVDDIIFGSTKKELCNAFEKLMHENSDELDLNVALDMIRMVSDLEIKNAMFSMGNKKSPGPDGFTAAFFKEVWDIVGNDVMLVVSEFFINGKLLKELNHTIIALIPK